MRSLPSRLLVLAADRPTLEFLTDNLSADGFAPLAARTIAEAWEILGCCRPAGALICPEDIEDGQGLDLVSRIRLADVRESAVSPDLPLLLLTTARGELDRLRAFERGCDDVLCRPYSYPELRARLEALLRRAASQVVPTRMEIGALVVDVAARMAFVDGTPVQMSRKEFALLRALATEPTRVFTRAELLALVWGYRGATSHTRTVDTHAHRLRNKLSIGGHSFVLTSWGEGYRLTDGVGLAQAA